MSHTDVLLKVFNDGADLDILLMHLLETDDIASVQNILFAVLTHEE